MSRPKPVYFLLVILALCSLNVNAIEVTPGQWEFTTTATMPMLPAPQTRTFTQCVSKSAFTPDDLSQQDIPCEFTGLEDSKISMSWTMTCKGPQGDMTGNWEFASTGNTLEGEGTMHFSMQGQEVEMKTAMSGKWSGDCDNNQ